MLFAKLTGGHVSGSVAVLEKFHKKSDIFEVMMILRQIVIYRCQVTLLSE